MTIVGALLGLVPGLSLGLALVVALVPVLAAGAVMPITLTVTVPTLSLTILGFLVVHLLVTALLYLFLLVGTGAPVIGAPTPTNAIEELARGAFIGMSTGINLTVLGSLPLLSVLAIPVALVNFLACIPAISNNRFYQVVLTYFALAMPTALPINLFGFGCLIVNVVGLALGLAPFTWFADWTHATYVTHGGITHGPQVTAWNQCNFTIAHPAMSRTDPWLPPGAAAPRADTVDGDLFHEGMHTANVAAFGWAFHLVGFIDALIRLALGAPGFNAYAELSAESGRRAATRPWVAIWTPSLQPPAPANDPPIGNYGIGGAGAVNMGDATSPGILETAVVRGTPLVATATSPPFAFVADVNGTYPEPLGFLWRTGTGLLAAPALAVAQVGGATFAFTPTTAGDTFVSLDATDGADGIARFQVVHALGAAIVPPPAGTVGNPVALDATASTAGLSNLVTTPFPLVFLWEVTAQPGGSAPVLGNPTGALATLIADVPGPYTVRVTVSAIFPVAGPGPATRTLTDTATAAVTIT